MKGWCSEFVGACLQAMHAGQRALPQANIRQQAGSYKGKRRVEKCPLMTGLDRVSNWRMKCTRRMVWAQIEAKSRPKPALGIFSSPVETLGYSTRLPDQN
jgi:hypothetical protein